MAALSATGFAAALKQHYTDERIENMVYKDNPFLAMVAKYEDFGGENLKLPIKYGNPMGRSATFGTAQSNVTGGNIKAFLLTRIKDYAIAQIENEVLEASKGNANAFLEAAVFAIDGSIQAATRSLAVALYGNGKGSIGVVSTSDSTTITLATTQDITNFEVDMSLVSSADESGGTAGTAISVTGINRDTGVLTMGADPSTIFTSTLKYIFVEGDYATDSTALLKVSGLGAWLPSTAPGSTDSFFNVNRSADVDRLGGIRFDGSSLPIEEALIGAAARAARAGGKPDYCFMNYSNFADLEKSLGSKVSYVEKNIKPEIGFRGILIHGPRGPLNVIPDQNCPNGVAYMIQMDVWKLYSLGKAPRILSGDGLKQLRVYNADAIEVRVGYYGQLGCRAPGWNVRIGL
ncbi:MAG: hypothetical protein CME31_13190 [Gimesia sp.]|nr:hypothetical protein [Gimesia sp.]